jgi:1-acyl-sn-glycerol-3-phosphate acyltransferase
MFDNRRMAFIKTVLIIIYVFVAMLILFPIGIVALFFYVLGLKKPMLLVGYKCAQSWAYTIVKLTRCRLTVSGRENIPKKGGVCFVSNHDGFFDIMLLLAYAGRPFGFIAKKELGFAPVLNAWIFILGGLFIDRKNVRRAVNTINWGIKKIKAGGGMLIFPEGHRSKGSGLQPFHPGSLKLATSAEAPIVPVAIKGSYDVFERTNRVTAAEVKLTFCPPIETAGLPSEGKKQLLSDRIYSVIKEELEK